MLGNNGFGFVAGLDSTSLENFVFSKLELTKPATILVDAQFQ